MYLPDCARLAADHTRASIVVTEGHRLWTSANGRWKMHILFWWLLMLKHYLGCEHGLLSQSNEGTSI
jgi:hypothetical protein